MSLRDLLQQDVLVIRYKGTNLQQQIKTKANIQPRKSFFGPDVDIQKGDVVRVLVSGEERKVADVNFIYKGNTVHHKEVRLVSVY
ncbi:hypothetical protein ES703_45944 [subsurface metagenome]